MDNLSNDSIAFHNCASFGQLQKCEDLLKSDTTDVLSVLDGLTALHRAAMSCKPSLCKFLVKHGIPINAVAHDGRTPLHCAVDCGDTLVFKCLIKLGADLTIKDINGKTPKDYYNENEGGYMKEDFEEALNEIQDVLDAKKLVCALQQQVAALKAGPVGQSLILALVNAKIS